MPQAVRAEAPIIATLQGDKQVTIRPLAETDRTILYNFGMALPKDDWLYLEEDLQNQEIILRLVNAHAAENWRQIVAESNGELVAYSAIRRLHGWSSHVADIRLIVAEPWRRIGLGTLMADATFEAARDLGATKVMVEVLEAQHNGKEIFERLGFAVEGILTKHACDRFGDLHNVILLSYHVQ